MEEVQSWWEVPAVAHFCYVFRSAFNLIFFEIAELESALLNIQDPDMSISLDQLIIRLLQGCYAEESVTEGNWEEKLHILFNENCEDGQNPFDDSQCFLQLTPRSKIEILLKLCELRLDVEGALEDIKNISPEDMQAKYLGKDNKKNKYWYFCDERLYKEDSSSEKKVNQVQKKNEAKSSTNKSSRQVSKREKRTKSSADIDKSWTVACFNVSDWEKLMKTFSKSKSFLEKELAKAIEDHLPVLQEKVSEKDRLLRKRFMELAPKRTSSRISKVQEKKKLEEMKAQEEARRAKLEAEKEEARKEALRLKEEKESRQKRAEMRHKAVEERAKRAKYREMARDLESEDDDDSSNQGNDSHGNAQNQATVYSESARNRQYSEEQSEESQGSDSEEYDSGSEYETTNASHQRTSKRKEIKQYGDNSAGFAQHDKSKRSLRTYSRYKEQTRSNEIRASSRIQSNPKTVKYRFDTDESEQDSDEASSEDSENEVSTRFPQNRRNAKDQSDSDESEDGNDSDNNNKSISDDSERDKSNDSVRTEDSVSVQHKSLTPANNYSNKSQDSSLNLPRVTVYKATLLKNSSDISTWNTELDSKKQKLHILNGTPDNLSPKRLKLEEVKSFRTASPNLKSSLSKENHIYQPVRQAPFITYGKIIPSSPSIVRLDFRKPPNPQASS